MTRKDWWLGIGVILLALLIQTAILLYVGQRNRDDKPRAKPLTAFLFEEPFCRYRTV
jgi:hypothetical protein